MTRTDLIKNLEYTKSKYKDKFVGTGEINIYEMVSDVLRYLNQPTTEINIDYYNELKAKADIGEAVQYLLNCRYPMAFATTEQIHCTEGGIFVTDADSLIDLYKGLSNGESEGGNE